MRRQRFGDLNDPIDESETTDEDHETSRIIGKAISETEIGGRIGPRDFIVKSSVFINHVDVYVRKGVLPPPFHRGLRIESMLTLRDCQDESNIVEHLLPPLRTLTTNAAKAAQAMLRVVDRLDATIAGRGMKLLSYRPVSYREGRYSGENLKILAVLSFIDEALRSTEAEFVLDSWVRSFRLLQRESSAQAKRALAQESGLRVDAVLHQALGTMTARERDRLAEVLLEGNRDARSQFREWTRAEMMSDNRLRLPECVETIRAKDGLVSGRVRLAPKVTFNRKTLQIGGHLPGSVMAGLEGKPIKQVVDHPWLPKDRRIATAKHHSQGRTSLTFDPPMVMIPSGIPVPD